MGYVFKAHAARADEFEDFELRKDGGDLLARGRRDFRRRGGAGFGGQGDRSQQARGAEALRRVRLQDGVALRTGVGLGRVGHVTTA